jgi:membrane associated rhomboid family serine protease
MGLYDRDYYRTEPTGYRLRGPRTMVGWIILINVLVYVADGLLTPTREGVAAGAFTINSLLACRPETLVKPWLWWQFLTCGFAHAPFPTINHVLFNMLELFFLGPPVEQRYGSREFLRLYLAMVVLGSVGWSAMGLGLGWPPSYHLIGASGAVTGVVFLFILNYPRQTLLFSFILPVPAWFVGVLLIVFNVIGPAYGEPGIAYEVHLAGIAFAAAYFYFGWNLSRLGGRVSLDWLKRRPKLRVRDPDRDDDAHADNLGQEVDRILEKIHLHGEASLTKKERRTLEAASREYQKHRRGDS